MPTPLNTLLKLSLVAIYLVAAVAQVTDMFSAYSHILLWVVGILAVAHVGEYLFLYKRLSSLPAKGPGHFLGTLLFGFLYWLPLIKGQSANA